MKTFKEYIAENTIDHRDLGSKGQIHRSYGDKKYGKVIKKEGTKVTFDVNGKHHSFKVV